MLPLLPLACAALEEADADDEALTNAARENKLSSSPRRHILAVPSLELLASRRPSMEKRHRVTAAVWPLRTICDGTLNEGAGPSSAERDSDAREGDTRPPVAAVAVTAADEEEEEEEEEDDPDEDVGEGPGASSDASPPPAAATRCANADDDEEDEGAPSAAPSPAAALAVGEGAAGGCCSGCCCWSEASRRIWP